MHPRTRYAKSEDVHIAYQFFGEGQVNLVFVPGFKEDYVRKNYAPS
jgi:hypothetical protein